MSQMTMVDGSSSQLPMNLPLPIEEVHGEESVGLGTLQAAAPLVKDAENNPVEFVLEEALKIKSNERKSVRLEEKEKENADPLPDVHGDTSPEIQKSLYVNIQPLSEKNFKKASASSPVKIVREEPLVLKSPEPRPKTSSNRSPSPTLPKTLNMSIEESPVILENSKYRKYRSPLKQKPSTSQPTPLNMSIDEDVLKELPEDIRLEIENERKMKSQKNSAKINSKKNPNDGEEEPRILHRRLTSSAGRSRILEEKPKTQSKRKPPAPKNSSKVIFSAREFTAAVAENAKSRPKKRSKLLDSDSEGSSTDDVSTISQKSKTRLVKHSTPLNSDSKGSLSEIPLSQPISPVRKKGRGVLKRAVKQSAKKSKLSKNSDDETSTALDETKTSEASSVKQSAKKSKLSKNSDDEAKNSEASVTNSSERRKSLTNRSKLNKKNKKGETPLHSACCKV